MTKILAIENLNIYYDNFHAVKDASLDLNQKDIVVICGPSGSGKSTLIRAIAGLEKYKSGKVLINEKKMSDETIRFAEDIESLKNFNSDGKNSKKSVKRKKNKR